MLPDKAAPRQEMVEEPRISPYTLFLQEMHLDQ